MQSDQHDVPVTSEEAVNTEAASGSLEESQGGDEQTNETEQQPSLEEQLLQWRDRALRTQADLENFKKRAAREKEETAKYGRRDLLEDLLPVLDNFGLGLSAARSGQEATSIVFGLEMVEKQLHEFLRLQGVEPVNCQAGDDFDPNLHDALGREESSEVGDGKILRQMRPGYRLHDRLLRPAAVFVASQPTAE